MLGLSSSLVKGGASLLTFVKDNLKLYLDFKSNKSDTLKFPSEGSTSFNGTSDYIAVPDNDSFDFGTGNMSVCAWINRASENTNDVIVAKKGSNELGWYFRVHSTDKIFLQVSDGTTDWYDYSSSTIPTGEWVHVCATWNPLNQKGKFYINGVESAGQYGTTANITGTTNNTSELRIGRDSDGYTTDWFHGSIANLAMWTRELEPEEIQSIMNKSYSQLKGVEKTSLVSWWALDSQSNGLVQPATGETLGIEKITSNTETDWTPYGSNDVDPTTNGVSVTNSDNDARGAVYNISGLTNGSLYKVVFNARSSNLDGNLKTYFNASTTYFSPAISTTDTQYTIYGYAGSSNSFQIFALDPDNTIFIENFSVKEVTSNTGVVTGATTTTSVYGGNAPILPRAVDVAKEGQADAIGNGSLTTSSGGYADLGNDSLIQFGGSFSVSCWFKTTDTTATNEMVIAKADDGVSAGWLIRLNSSRKLDFSYVNSASGGVGVTISDTGSAVNDGEWYHVAFVHESGVGNRAYKNGILIGSNSTGTDLESHTPNLHVGSQDYSSARPLDGSFAQVGLWQGALTQAQIQSVMESTSYSKIPADVKSTLGTETLTHDFSDGTGVTVPSELSVASGKTTFNGEMVVDGGDVSSAYYSIADNVTWDTSKLYKIVVVCSAYTSGALSHQGGSRAFGVTFGISSSIGGVGTFTNYAVPSSDGLITLRSQSFVGTLSSISIKEVTNDIVAYYPLDGDSSDTSNSGVGITNDVTTGETLGSNTFGGLNQFVAKGSVETVEVSGDELTLTIASGNDAGMNTGNLANLGLSTSLGYAVNDLVKLQFQAKIVTNGSGFGETVRWYDVNQHVFPATNISLTSEYQTFTFYAVISNLGYSIPSFLRMGNRTGTDVYNLKNFSVQKVTSNTGVLK